MSDTKLNTGGCHPLGYARVEQKSDMQIAMERIKALEESLTLLWESHENLLGNFETLSFSLETNNQSPEAFGALLKRIEILEAVIRTSRSSTDVCMENYSLRFDKCIRILNGDLASVYERIEKLEKENETRQDTIACVDRAYDESTRNIENRLDELESFINKVKVAWKSDIDNYQKMYDSIGRRLESLENSPFGKSPTYEPLFERLNAIENILNSMDGIKEIWLAINELRGFKAAYPLANENFVEINVKSLHQRIDQLENGAIKRIGILGNALSDVSNDTYKENKTPHKCPVCHGSGNMDFFINKTGVKCEPCEGKGIVWG